MKAKEFKGWRKAHGLSQTGAARKPSLRIRAIQYYEKGKREDKPVAIPKAVAFACFAISCGIDDVDYSRPEGRAIRPNP
jgi:transcriptional regulator with XRE-family HTH domain